MSLTKLFAEPRYNENKPARSDFVGDNCHFLRTLIVAKLSVFYTLAIQNCLQCVDLGLNDSVSYYIIINSLAWVVAAIEAKRDFLLSKLRKMTHSQLIYISSIKNIKQGRDTF